MTPKEKRRGNAERGRALNSKDVLDGNVRVLMH